MKIGLGQFSDCLSKQSAPSRFVPLYVFQAASEWSVSLRCDYTETAGEFLTDSIPGELLVVETLSL